MLWMSFLIHDGWDDACECRGHAGFEKTTCGARSSFASPKSTWQIETLSDRNKKAAAKGECSMHLSLFLRQSTKTRSSLQKEAL
jgi:hypothetical protein